MARYSVIDPNEFTDLLDLLTNSWEFRADNDSTLALYQLKRECQIVHAMSHEERNAPEIVLEEARLRRIAEAAGVTTVEVAYLVHRQREGVSWERYSNATVHGWRVTTHCDATHAEMPTGKCPWCGRELFKYRPRW